MYTHIGITLIKKKDDQKLQTSLWPFEALKFCQMKESTASTCPVDNVHFIIFQVNDEQIFGRNE